MLLLMCQTQIQQSGQRRDVTRQQPGHPGVDVGAIGQNVGE